MSNRTPITGAAALWAARSQLTPLLALIGLLLGIFAALNTPREEEPQIDVTMANLFVAFPGAAAVDVASLITTPMEQVLAEIADIEHIYSTSRPGMAILTVQFKVGVPRTEALVRLYNAVQSNQDWRPANLGIGPVLVKPKSIDDVPIVTLTLTSSDDSPGVTKKQGAMELTELAHSLETELKRVLGTRNISTIGGAQPGVQIQLSPQRLAAHNIDINELRQALQAYNGASHAGNVIADNQAIAVQAGDFFARPDELGELVVGMHNGRPVYLQAVADINYGPPEYSQYVWQRSKDAEARTAVTVQISKKPGENAVDIARQVLQRVDALQGVLIPHNVTVEVTRNYGDTANDKANKLIQKLIFASLSVIVLVFLTMGWREAIVVGAAVILTLGITLFASWAYGFTLNRVSLFALIFSIGILVDDAIVVVENIHRHLQQGGKTVLQAIPGAVGEVGGPTVLATFTVIAALLPMAFVSGLMGPYMSPIPINASMGMFISLLVAFSFTPWMSNRLLRSHAGEHTAASDNNQGFTARFFHKTMTPFLGDNKRGARYLLLLALVLLIGITCSLAVFKIVVLKMLPFDNKSEFQVVVDMPEGTALEETNAVLMALSDELLKVDEVTDLQIYAGTSAPIGFNGLVRQYYLRSGPILGDIQVNLLDKHHRDRSSHAIALAVRPALAAIGEKYHAAVRVVEVPPGPPVMSPLVAEVYGPDYNGQLALAEKVMQQFGKTADIVDIDSTREDKVQRILVHADRTRAAQLGISPSQLNDALTLALSGEDVTYLHTGHAKYPVPLRLDFAAKDKADINHLLQLKIRSQSGELVPISEFATVSKGDWQQTIYRKDLLPVVYVTGDMAGKLDSPLYGMFEIIAGLGDSINHYYTKQPSTPFNYSIKWDGEWQITYETFRDMGAAYSVGLLLIYLLVVSQFRSYLTPIIIMAPIPMTLIGIMPGHALLGAQFTATSMIGMIALAGILVRNSILLVDFINHSIAQGMDRETAIVQSAIVRAKPIVLTAVAAMMGAFFILSDPIFNGLAVSLIFGIFVSTALTLIVVPLLYYGLLRRRKTI